jgi:hypothetical protein
MRMFGRLSRNGNVFGIAALVISIISQFYRPNVSPNAPVKSASTATVSFGPGDSNYKAYCRYLIVESENPYEYLVARQC